MLSIGKMFEAWATKWGIPPEAIADLLNQLTHADNDPALILSDETSVQNNARHKATKSGGRLWRNNNGEYRDRRGVPVRYGICNDSAKLNKRLKSSDLIGIYPRVITPGMVGQTIGQFWAVECKRPGWTYKGKPREAAQLAYLQLVIALGGLAYFERG